MLKNLLNNDVEIELVKDNFTSPVLGNVWIGRRVTLNRKTAEHFVHHGYAKLVTESAAPEADDEAAKKKADDENQAKVQAEIDAVVEHFKAADFTIDQEDDGVPASLTLTDAEGQEIAKGALHELVERMNHEKNLPPADTQQQPVDEPKQARKGKKK